MRKLLVALILIGVIGTAQTCYAPEGHWGECYLFILEETEQVTNLIDKWYPCFVRKEY